MAALSAGASGSSGWVTMGLVGLGFSAGVRAYWLVPGVLLGVAFNWFVLAGPLRDDAARLGSLTIPDYLSQRFRERWPLLRLLSVAVILTAMFLYVAAQLAAAGKAFEATFAGVDYRLGVAIGMGIILTYTVLGGFRAASWTDLAQALLMLAVLLGLPLYLLLFEGGPRFLAHSLHAADPALLAWKPPGVETPLAIVAFLLGSQALGINLGYPGQPHVLVRFMALRSRREAWTSGAIALTWTALIYAGAVTVGLFTRAMSEAGAAWGQAMLADPSSQGELALLVATMHLTPSVFAGAALAAILAAIASTADSQLVVAGSAVASDVYARLIDRRRRQAHTLVNRLVVLTLGLAAGLLVFDRDVRIYTFVLQYGWAMLGAAFGPQVALAALWRRATGAGCLAGMAVGFAVAILWPRIYDATATGVPVYNLTVAFACALAVNVVVSLLTQARSGPAVSA
ncbi:MAG: sodium:proline symporter [Planctomycetota bacterium]|nr:MAG: sodium:proline symporter [Planctomycetota bacterium]